MDVKHCIQTSALASTTMQCKHLAYSAELAYSVDRYIITYKILTTDDGAHRQPNIITRVIIIISNILAIYTNIVMQQITMRNKCGQLNAARHVLRKLTCKSAVYTRPLHKTQKHCFADISVNNKIQD